MPACTPEVGWGVLRDLSVSVCGLCVLVPKEERTLTCGW